MSTVGRPKSANPKNKRFEIRLSEIEEQDLQYCSDKLRISKAEVVSKGVQMVKADIDNKNKSD